MSEEVQPTAAASQTQEPATPAEAQKPETPETTFPTSWEEVFQHPRFKQLNEDYKGLQKKVKDAEKAAEAAAKKQAEEQGEYKRLYEEAEARRLEAEQKATAAELARLKTSVATKLQLPAALIDRLRGETEEELEADAKALLDAMPRPTVPAANDAAAGINGSKPTPQKTEREIKEEAARLNVSIQALKQYYGVM